MRKEKSLYRWYCSFSLSPSRSVEFVFQTRQLLFSLFPRLCWTLIFRARLRIMHIAFIHRILPCEDWLFFSPPMLHETTKTDLQFNYKHSESKKRIKKNLHVLFFQRTRIVPPRWEEVWCTGVRLGFCNSHAGKQAGAGTGLPKVPPHTLRSAGREGRECKISLCNANLYCCAIPLPAFCSGGEARS